jgi:putative nucleotidyltransferase with HDIG domain
MELIPLMGEKSTDFGGFSGKLVSFMANQTFRVVAWMTVLWTGAIIVAASLMASGEKIPTWWVLLGLAVVGAVAERQSVPVTGTTEASVGFLPFVFTAVAFGPLAAFIVGALAALADFRRPYMRWAVYLPVRAISLATAGIAAGVVSPHDGHFTRILLASLIASLTNQAMDLAFNMATFVVRHCRSPFDLLRTVGPLLVLSLSLYVPLVALLVYGFHRYSIAIVGTFLVPALALQRLTQLYQVQRETAQRLVVANTRLERANLSFASALVATLDARDRYTAGHSATVAVYSRDIAARMGLTEDLQQLAHLCGLVHDIGKVGLPAGLLEKPGALTLDERRQMEEHSVIGERILANVEDYETIAKIVRHHHERVDGMGYPDRLVGDEIPLVSRIIAVADAYDAMTSDRPYRDAMPSRVARLRLAQAVESQFDTGVVAAFEAILVGATEAYRAGAGSTFNFEIQRRASTGLSAVAV